MNYIQKILQHKYTKIRWTDPKGAGVSLQCTASFAVKETWQRNLADGCETPANLNTEH